jgi:hypothetical protein
MIGSGVVFSWRGEMAPASAFAYAVEAENLIVAVFDAFCIEKIAGALNSGFLWRGMMRCTHFGWFN